MPSLGNVPRPAYVYDTETDTWVPIGVGAHTHDYIPNTLVDAKGDILTATADNVPARLAKGADGTVLVSDSTTQTGLAWQPYGAIQVAGKNKIINGDFSIWQRGTTFNNAGVDSYTSDRWNVAKDGTATINVSQQSFTPGSAPVSGYEGQYFLRFDVSSWTSLDTYLQQKIEDVRTFSGQTITVSFWAKANASYTNRVLYYQAFGTGGSSIVVGNQDHVIGTTWSRHILTFNIPSIAGKTIGPNSIFGIQFLRFQGTRTVDIWGVQVESGPVATPFTTHTGSIQGELAACRRYYYRFPAVGSYTGFALGFSYSTNLSYYHFPLIPEMRTAPTSIEFSGLGAHIPGQYIDAVTALSISTNERSSNAIMLTATTTSNNLTVNRPYFLAANNNTNAYIGLSAEL